MNDPRITFKGPRPIFSWRILGIQTRRLDQEAKLLHLEAAIASAIEILERVAQDPDLDPAVLREVALKARACVLHPVDPARAHEAIREGHRRVKVSRLDDLHATDLNTPVNSDPEIER